MEWLLPGLVTLFGKEHQTVMEKQKQQKKTVVKNEWTKSQGTKWKT